MSPDFAKNVQSLTTRVNKKKPKSKKKRSSNYKPLTIKEEEEEILAIKAIVEPITTKPEATIESNMANINTSKSVSFYQKSQDARITLPPANRKAFRLLRSILVNVKGEDIEILLDLKLF
jgi:hypothetical protein